MFLFFIKKRLHLFLHSQSIRLGLCEASLITQTVDIGKHIGVGRPVNLP